MPDGGGVTVEGIAGAVRERLASYKRPKRIVLLDSLPPTALGKVDKVRLRSELRAV